MPPVSKVLKGADLLPLYMKKAPKKKVIVENTDITEIKKIEEAITKFNLDLSEVHIPPVTITSIKEGLEAKQLIENIFHPLHFSTPLFISRVSTKYAKGMEQDLNELEKQVKYGKTRIRNQLKNSKSDEDAGSPKVTMRFKPRILYPKQKSKRYKRLQIWWNAEIAKKKVNVKTEASSEDNATRRDGSLEQAVTISKIELLKT
mmetsp:Transcript_31787/g.48798  ORF Transcript_31787/g.48798 Transcript_31787/m.48798 type:complete len:203 (-) Transcript_31787:769-1377(-)|eukprot:CAMPEP_0170512674 /NCGR_PEP_ID=MMETSP0208-20121228/66976_1 /TAXON_ID=197538 /ORGANISM="Strombidium inclinatum, Strain S3" /LENGTH=202 /DNA_ID=CAMNT_0010796329 /DNA_START=536 /DNA_END=1144 /DNA_ORIENTATION=+